MVKNVGSSTMLAASGSVVAAARVEAVAFWKGANAAFVIRSVGCWIPVVDRASRPSLKSPVGHLKLKCQHCSGTGREIVRGQSKPVHH